MSRRSLATPTETTNAVRLPQPSPPALPARLARCRVAPSAAAASSWLAPAVPTACLPDNRAATPPAAASSPADGKESPAGDSAPAAARPPRRAADQDRDRSALIARQSPRAAQAAHVGGAWPGGSG